jgi:hypothetical protein
MNSLPISRRLSRFVAVLLAIAAGALVIRVGYIAAFKQDLESCHLYEWVPENLCGDAYVYHEGANLLVDGKGFISPPNYAFGGELRPSADHPPTYVLYLAAWSLLGARSVLWHQLASALLGTAGVVLTGLLGRHLGRRIHGVEHVRLGTVRRPSSAADRTGWLAAALVAVAPLIWVNDALVMSETAAFTATIAMVWCALRWWEQPTWQRAVWFGATAGICAQARAELVLYAPAVAGVALIAALITSAARRTGRAKPVCVSSLVVGAVMAAVMAPWMIRNLTTFKYPVTLSTGLGITLTYTNCDAVYYGDTIGYWSLPCIYDVDLEGTVDQSDDERRLREHGLNYLKANKDRLPVVMAARLGRQWGFYKVDQMSALDTFDARERNLSRAGWLFYYPSMIGAAVGLWRLRSARVPLCTFVIVPIIITLAAAMTYGSTRFRVPSDALALVLSAVAIFGAPRTAIAAMTHRDHQAA